VSAPGHALAAPFKAGYAAAPRPAHRAMLRQAGMRPFTKNAKTGKKPGHKKFAQKAQKK
jgi:hypothetical protein